MFGGLTGNHPCESRIRKHLAAWHGLACDKFAFGLSSGPAREWEKVVRVYSKGNVYLGEAALTLASNVDYEIPLLRKQAATWNGQISDFEKKEEELISAARAANAAFAKECTSLSIKVRCHAISGPHSRSNKLGPHHRLDGASLLPTCCCEGHCSYRSNVLLRYRGRTSARRCKHA